MIIELILKKHKVDINLSSENITKLMEAIKEYQEFSTREARLRDLAKGRKIRQANIEANRSNKNQIDSTKSEEIRDDTNI